MPVRKFRDNYKLLTAGEKIATWSTIVSFFGVLLGYITWINPASSHNLVDSLQSNAESELQPPQVPVIISANNRTSLRNQISPLEVMEILESYSTDSAKLDYLNIVKDDISISFDLTNLLALLDLMEDDAAKLRAFKLIEGKTVMLYPADIKIVLKKFDSDSSMNAASKIIRASNDLASER